MLDEIQKKTSLNNIYCFLTNLSFVIIFSIIVGLFLSYKLKKFYGGMYDAHAKSILYAIGLITLSTISM